MAEPSRADRTIGTLLRLSFSATLLGLLAIGLFPHVFTRHLSGPRRAGVLISSLYWILAETIFRTRTAATSRITVDDRRTTNTNGILLVAATAGPFIVHASGAKLPFDVPAVDDSLAVWGPPLAAALIGVVLRFWAMATLKDSFTRTLTVRPGQAVNQSGPYALVRHPGYLANGLVFVGTALLVSGNALVAAVTAALFLATWHIRIAAEEAMLLRELPAYREYAARVSYRMVPGVY